MFKRKTTRHEVSARGKDTPRVQEPSSKEAFKRYLAVVSRVFAHIQAHDPGALTELRRRARLRKKAEKSA